MQPVGFAPQAEMTYIAAMQRCDGRASDPRLVDSDLIVATCGRRHHPALRGAGFCGPARALFVFAECKSSCSGSIRGVRCGSRGIMSGPPAAVGGKEVVLSGERESMHEPRLFLGRYKTEPCLVHLRRLSRKGAAFRTAKRVVSVASWWHLRVRRERERRSPSMTRCGDTNIPGVTHACRGL